MRNKEKRLRKLLGLKMSTPISRSSRLERALMFVDRKANRSLPFYIIRSSDYGWGGRRCRTDEGVVNAEIIGADGNKNSRSGYHYIWIYAYTRKRCRHCGRLVAWGHENPMAPVCSRCAWEILADKDPEIPIPVEDVQGETMKVEQDNNAKNLCEDFGSPMGTSTYHSLGLCLITDGVRDLAESYNCHWAIVKIAIMTYKVFAKNHQYTQVWKLCIKNHHATLYCLGYPLPPDYDVDEVVYSENIKYTDLPDGEMLFKVGIGEPPIICLPIED